MLRLILGRAGSGKTRFALEKAREIFSSGGRAVMAVPEQFTFATERALLALIGPKSCLNVEVLSFSRMTHRVFSQYGGLARTYIDDCGRYIVMQRALRQVGDLLKTYGRQAKSPAFIKTMVQAVSEYKLCGISSDDLLEAEKKADDGVLRRKLEDIALIMGTYDAILSSGFADTLDDLDRLARKLEEAPFFKGKTVIIDSFKGFTPQEKSVLARIFAQADDVYVTLCADRLADVEKGMGLFSPVRKTAAQLISLARKSGVRVAAPAVLGAPRRFENEALAAMESKIFVPGAQPYRKDTPQIHIVSAANIYDEAQFAVQEIRRLVREQGCRWRDIVVISRGLSLYRGIIEPVFEKYDIPLFYDERRSMETHPLMALLLSALDILTGNYPQDAVFRYLKTGLAGIDTVEVSMLENYALTWDLNGEAMWTREWKNNPEGFAQENEADSERLERLNSIRDRFVRPIESLSQSLKKAKSAKEMAAALYDFLCALGADRAVTENARELSAAGEVELADEYRQIWDKLMGIFDQIAATLKDTPLTSAELSQVLHLTVANADLAHIPPTLDEVTAGDAERIRAGNARYAFVIGLAEGVFPRAQAPGGLLSDAERERLIRMGLELSPASQERSVKERFIAYQAFTCASREVYLCCPRSDAAGKALRPSHYLLEARRLFPKCDFHEDALQNPFDGVQNEASAFEMLAVEYGNNGAGERALTDYFASLPEYKEKLTALKAAADKEPKLLRDRQTAKALFGTRMHLSPSRVESYEQCPFLFFCRYGMRAMPRRKAKLAAPEIGMLVHFVLERLLSGLDGEKLWEVGEEELEKRVSALLDEFAKGFLGGLEDKPERFRYLYARLSRTVLSLVEHLARELSHSAFSPVDFELSIAGGGQVEPVVIALADGGEIAVEGKVDRVDLMKRGGKTYLRVVDYKTGAKSFDLADVVYGLNLQMLIYLFTLCENGRERYKAEKILPAGVLYMPARQPDAMESRGRETEAIKKDADSRLKMSGLVAADAQVIEGMEQGGGGVFIPAKLKNGEPDLKGSVASFEQLGALHRHIAGILRDMASSLRLGEIDAVPAEGLSYCPCDYCDYTCVCGHERGDKTRRLWKLNKTEAWEAIDDAGKKVDKGTEAGD